MDKKKIMEHFMNNTDLQGLQELYNQTKDELVQILINWKEYYQDELEDVYATGYSMYDDVLDYLFKKYDLDNYKIKNNT